MGKKDRKRHEMQTFIRGNTLEGGGVSTIKVPLVLGKRAAGDWYGTERKDEQ